MTLSRQVSRLRPHVKGRGPWRIVCENCDMEERGGGKESDTPSAYDWVVKLVDAGWGVCRHDRESLCPDCYAVDMDMAAMDEEWQGERNG